MSDDSGLAETRAELDEVKKELAELRTRPKRRLRRVAVVVLILAGFLTAVAGDLAAWTQRTALSTDAWVRTVSALPEDSKISKALAAYLTDELFESTNLQQTIEEALPEDASFLAGPLTSAMESFVADQAQKLIQSDQFAAIWAKVNESAHELLVAVLEGDGDVLKSSDGKVVVDLKPALDALAENMGVDLSGLLDNIDIPDDAGQFVLIEDDQLAEAQAGVELLRTLGWFIPLMMLVFFGGAIAVSPDRRRTTVTVGVTVALAMLTVLVAADIGEQAVLDLVRNPENRGAAEAFLKIVTRGLVDQTRMVLVFGLLVALGAWVAGPSSAAGRVRGLVRAVGQRGGDQLDDAPDFVRSLAPRVARQAGIWRGSGIAAVLVLLIWWSQPTVRVVLSLGLALVIYLVVVQVLVAAGTEKPDDDEIPVTSGDEPRTSPE